MNQALQQIPEWHDVDEAVFRNEIATGPGGSEILLDDPSGNPIELFQPAR